MHPCIPPFHRGEGWIDDGKTRVVVEGKGVRLVVLVVIGGGNLVMMTQAALLNSSSKAAVKDERRRRCGESERA